MKNLKELFEGKKAYISAGLIAIATFLKTIELITPDQFTALITLFGAFGLVAVAARIKRLSGK